MRQQSEVTDFPALTVVQKHKAIEKCLVEQVHAMLQADGGSMEVIDIKENAGTTEVYIRFLGACRHCPSSTKGTLQGIESVLKKELSDTIRVLPV
jgi:NifU-like protein